MRMLVGIFVFVFLNSLSVKAQERSIHEVYAAMVFNFIKYVQWPDEGTQGEFVVGVIGDDDVYNTLKQWYDGKPKGAKKYVIKRLTAADEAYGCQVVFMGRSKSRDFDALKSSVKGRSVLTITEGNGLGERGSCINFKQQNGKLRFELNQTVVTNANLKVAGQLSSMAIQI